MVQSIKTKLTKGRKHELSIYVIKGIKYVKFSFIFWSKTSLVEAGLEFIDTGKTLGNFEKFFYFIKAPIVKFIYSQVG